MKKLLSVLLLLALLLASAVPACAAEDYARVDIHSHYWKAYVTGYVGSFSFSAAKLELLSTEDSENSHIERYSVLLHPDSTITVERDGSTPAGSDFDACITGFTSDGEKYWLPLDAGTYTAKDFFSRRTFASLITEPNGNDSGDGPIGPFSSFYLATDDLDGSRMVQYQYTITIDAAADCAPGAPEPEPIVLADVDENDYRFAAVTWAAELGITKGRGSDEEGRLIFDPDAAVTRGEAMTFLWRAKGCPEPETAENPFSDAPKDYYRKAILWAVEQGVTNGTTWDEKNGVYAFSPEREVTCGQMLTFLWRTEGKPGYSGEGLGSYADAEYWAHETGVLGDAAATYATVADCRRGDVVYYLLNAVLLHSMSGDSTPAE